MLLFFAVSLFVSSFLLFLVQPVIGKMILPSLGGTPAVWNTCMVFFQAVLLVGYAYTHSLSTWSNRRLQMAMHVGVLLLPILFLTLPFSMGDWQPPVERNPVWDVLWLLLGMVGLPFFVVATSAPLLQKWFTYTGHPQAQDPYFLYGASNLGSMLALVLYPVLVEPYFSLPDQGWLWTIGYGMLLALVAVAGILVWQRAADAIGPLSEAASEPQPASQPAPKTVATATATTAIQVRKKQRGRGTQGQASSSKAAELPAPSADVSWRYFGLACLPLAAMLLTARYLSRGLVHEVILWGVLWGIFLLGLLPFFRLARWRQLSEAQRGILMLQGVLSVGLFALLLAELEMSPPVEFIPYLALALIPLYVLFGQESAPSPERGGAPTLARRLRWIGLAAAPSSLMLGVTTYLTTDIAAVPLFWIIPLALYLLTFILVFSRWPVPWTGTPHTVVLVVQPFTLIMLVLLAAVPRAVPAWMLFSLHLLVFFLTALMCHGELAKDRPAHQYLTEYYLWMSLGGVLGGLFNGLVAPLFFWFGVVEYPLAGLLALLLRPNMVDQTIAIPGDSRPGHPTDLGRVLDLAFPAAAGVLTFLVLTFFTSIAAQLVLVGLAIAFCAALYPRPARMGLGLAAILLASGVLQREFEKGSLIFEERTFFGFLRVRQYVRSGTAHGKKYVITYRILYHGGIDHGRQFIEAEGFPVEQELRMRRKPITYFTPESGVGQIFEVMKGATAPVAYSRADKPPEEFWPDARFHASLVGLGAVPWGQVLATQSQPPYAVVGLGLGTLAAHARPYQHLTIYEIDPAVIRLSTASEKQDPMFFYVEDARQRGAGVDLIPGDGRLSIKRAPERYHHIIVLDAFSGDAIPVHLLTDEAIREYLSKLADGGVLIFNATNRYVDIRPVLADLAKKYDLVCYSFGDSLTQEQADEEQYFYHNSSDWTVLQRRQDPFIKGRDSEGRPIYSADFNGGLPPLADRLRIRGHSGVPDKGRAWTVPEATGRFLWTDAYSNLLRALSLKGSF